jgi:hypothetical protein
MAPRTTRAAAKAQTETTPSTDAVENPFDAEDQTPEPERDSEPEELDEEGKSMEEDMSKAKGKKSKKGGKKKGKKAKTDAPEVTPAQVIPEIVEEAVTAPAAIEDGEFNAAAMPVLRSPKKEVEPEAIGEYRHIASTDQIGD